MYHSACFRLKFVMNYRVLNACQLFLNVSLPLMNASDAVCCLKYKTFFPGSVYSK